MELAPDHADRGDVERPAPLVRGLAHLIERVQRRVVAVGRHKGADRVPAGRAGSDRRIGVESGQDALRRPRRPIGRLAGHRRRHRHGIGRRRAGGVHAVAAGSPVDELHVDERHGPSPSVGLQGRFYAAAVGAPLAERFPAPARLPPGCRRPTLGWMAVDGRTRAEPRTRVRLCGRPSLEIDGRDAFAGVPEGQRRLLLIHLLAHRQAPVDRDALIDVLWPSGAPDNAKANLRVIASKLRRAVAPAELDGRTRMRLVLPEPVWVDVDEATNAIASARAAARNGRWRDVLAQAGEAIDLLRPGFVPGVDASWLDDRRGELEELELEALEWTAQAGLALGGADLPAAQRAAADLVARAPFRESAHRLRMETMAASGNVAEALQAYEELRRILRDELGATPSPEVQALHQRLLDGDVAPAPHPNGAGPHARVPLPALLLRRDRAAFVGRGPEIETLRQAWADTRGGNRRLVVLCGEPGIGKTRLAGELAREAHTGGTVLYGACQEDAVVSYQPFVEALRHYAREGAQVALGPGGTELARLIPELSQEQA